MATMREFEASLSALFPFAFARVSLWMTCLRFSYIKKLEFHLIRWRNHFHQFLKEIGLY
jgi:hypothetical protein